MAQKSRKAPWKKPNPKARKKKPTRHLSSSEKAEAKRRARKAGRPYPNLVDNMHVAAKRTKSKKKRASARKHTRR